MIMLKSKQLQWEMVAFARQVDVFEEADTAETVSIVEITADQSFKYSVISCSS